MAKWNVGQIKAEIRGIYPSAVIMRTRGEDVTTDGLQVQFPDNGDDSLFLQGFVVEGMIPAHDDVDVEMVELTSGYSDGGLVSSDLQMIQLYADIRKILATAGFVVVNSLDEYF